MLAPQIKRNHVNCVN